MDTPTPKPNEFVIPENQAYAATNIVIWRAAEFLMTKLEPLDIDQLNPNDGECTICQQKYCVDEDEKVSHTPVMTVCGHIFGKRCIIQWLNPTGDWGLELTYSGPNPGENKTNCPICRRDFFYGHAPEPLNYLAWRLVFWDRAYDSAGVSRSEKEELSRKHLWAFVKYCSLINVGTLSMLTRGEIDRNAQLDLLYFSRNLKNQLLTPEQEIRRKKLERIGRKDLTKCAVDGFGRYVFDTDRDDDERVNFRDMPLT